MNAKDVTCIRIAGETLRRTGHVLVRPGRAGPVLAAGPIWTGLHEPGRSADPGPVTGRSQRQVVRGHTARPVTPQRPTRRAACAKTEKAMKDAYRVNA